MAFCDWLSIYQVHLQAVELVNDGRVFSVDQDGVVKWDIASKLVHRGSHDTSIRIRSDGHRVTFDGNIGRFNRPDNLFGYSVSECIQLANKLLAEFGLPPFTDTPPMLAVSVTNNGDVRAIATGAVITRVDLTRNWAAGSPASCEQFIRHLQGFKSGRQEPRAYKTTGVSWGEGSQYWYAKVYDKAGEYFRGCGKKSKRFDPQLYGFMYDNGVARHEISLKSRYLKQNDLWRPSQWKGDAMERVYALFTDVVHGGGNVDEFLEIEGRAGELAVAWRDGADLKKRLSQNTYYRYRRQLLKFNIDIAVPANVQRLRTRVEVVVVAPLVVPDWYSLPKVA